MGDDCTGIASFALGPPSDYRCSGIDSMGCHVEISAAHAKIADALVGNDENHRDLRRGYLILQLFYEWAGADFVGEGKCLRALSS